MVDIVSGITAATGLFSAFSSSESAGAAGDAASAQAAALFEQIQFAKEQYADWQEVYGPIEENLASFYTNLDSETLIASGLQKQQQAFQEAMKQMRRKYAQQDITGGAQTQLEQEARLENARQRAGIRAAAPLAAAEAQGQFLGIGKGIANPYGTSVTQALQGMASAQGGIAGNQQNLATAYQSEAFKSLGSLAPTLQSAWDRFSPSTGTATPAPSTGTTLSSAGTNVSTSTWNTSFLDQ